MGQRDSLREFQTATDQETHSVELDFDIFEHNGLGERARLGRSGPGPRGPLGTRESVHCLVRSFAPVFGPRARRTAVEAAALPIRFDSIVTAKPELCG